MVGETNYRRTAKFGVNMKGTPNIIMIVLDTLRKDTIEARLPGLRNLNYLAKESIFYDNAISPSSWTIPSHASILTGRYPSEHKVDYRYEDEAFLKAISGFPLELPLLQSELRKMGYTTLSLVANPLVGEDTAFDMSYDRVENIGPLEVYEKSARRIRGLLGDLPRKGVQLDFKAPMSKLSLLRKTGVLNTIRIMNTFVNMKRQQFLMRYPAEKGGRQIVAQLESLKLETPFFVLINLMEMHEPYRSVRDFGSVERGFMQARVTGERKKLDEFGSQLKGLQEELSTNMQTVDTIVGRLIEFLRKKKLYENTILIITSDHGQSVGESDFVGHSYLLTDELVRVPLMIKTHSKVCSHVNGIVSTSGIYDFILGGVSTGNWRFPETEYVFSEAFGVNKARWIHYMGELSDRYHPELRKRIWSRDGLSLTVNGTLGVIEDFKVNGKASDPSSMKPDVKALLAELDLFVGNSNFILPDY